MATIITNRATLNYRYGTATASTVSNVTNTVLNGQLDISKTSLSEVYRIGQNIGYVITVTNNGTAALENVLVTDNLGTYDAFGNLVTPLTFAGNAQLFVNGVFVSPISGTVAANSVTFTVPNIPAGGNVQIIYEATVNEYANGSSGSLITNTATANTNCDCPCEETVTDTNTITAEDYADVRIVKSVCPNPIVCGGELKYTFDIYNYGNIPATDVVLVDVFEPALSDITVYVNGVEIDAANYSYVGGTLTLPAESSTYEITIPAANYVQDETTGIVAVTPGQVQIIVTGTL